MRYTPDPKRFQLISSKTRPHERCRFRHNGISGRFFTNPARWFRATACAAVFAAALAPLASPATWAATPPPLRVSHAAVASDHRDASATGLAALRAGGNAADAACAAALALGVVNPHASGLGGGGFALIYVAKEKKTYALDFREQAPSAIKPELFLAAGADRAPSRRGGLAVAVPGEVRGLAQLVKRFGRRSWQDCVQPAERLAAAGFRATPVLAEAVEAGSGADSADPDPKTNDAYLAQIVSYHSPLHAGDLVRRPALAATLHTLRTRGPESFYAGPLAAEIAAAVRASGGVLSAEDLARYQVIERIPLTTSYRGHRIFAMPPPSSGGIVIAEALGILAARIPDPSKIARGSSGYLHLLAETLKHGFADRARLLGDADFVKVPLESLLDPGYHQKLAAKINDRGVLPIDQYGRGPGVPPPKDHGTAHLCVIDAEGNAVALTSTVNTWFGARVVVGKTGIVLNNQMDDFSIAPNTPNAFGLIGSAQNRVAPGKRPLSSMSPTIVLQGDEVQMVLGGAGGPTIISAVLQVMLNVIDGHMDAQAASAAPRIHHQWQPENLVYEADIPQDVVDGLVRRGHKVEPRDSMALVNVIVRTADGLEAAAEFRGGGAPAGY